MSENEKSFSELNSEIVEFWATRGSSIKKIQISTSIQPVIVHYINDTNNTGYPKLSNVVAFEHYDGDITYRWNNKTYSESEMLRMINLKAFI